MNTSPIGYASTFAVLFMPLIYAELFSYMSLFALLLLFSELYTGMYGASIYREGTDILWYERWSFRKMVYPGTSFGLYLCLSSLEVQCYFKHTGLATIWRR